MRNLIFLISEAQHNFRNKLFDLVEAQHNSLIAELNFRTKLKCNLTGAIKISQHKANIALLSILNRKRVTNLLKKANIYQHYDRNGAKLSLMYKIALLTDKKKIESAAQFSATNFKDFDLQCYFCNVLKYKLKAQRSLRICGGCGSCALRF